VEEILRGTSLPSSKLLPTLCIVIKAPARLVLLAERFHVASTVGFWALDFGQQKAARRLI